MKTAAMAKFPGLLVWFMGFFSANASGFMFSSEFLAQNDTYSLIRCAAVFRCRLLCTGLTSRRCFLSMVTKGGPGSTENLDYADYLREQMETLSAPLTALFSFTLTGTAAFIVSTRPRHAQDLAVQLDVTFPLQREVNDSVEADTSSLDSIVLPAAFVVMAVFVKSLRLLVVPLFCIAVSVLGSFAVVFGLTKHMDIPAFVGGPAKDFVLPAVR